MTIVNKILRTSAIIISTLALTGMAASASANDVTLEVINIENAQGTLRIAIYDTEDSYNTETVYRALAQPAVKGSVEIVLSDLPIGQYGVMLFHDTNDNNELDTNLMGIPNEPWGVLCRVALYSAGPDGMTSASCCPKPGIASSLTCNRS